MIGIDVGNSSIKIGLFRKKKLLKVFEIPTKEASSLKVPSYWEKISPLWAGIASVVPSVNYILKDKFSGICGKNIFFITPSDCGLPLKIKNPDKVGVDRVLNSKAAVKLLNTDVIVIDIGTAITIDYASKKGFMGGVIIPGPSLWKGSLTTTAMIKDVKKVKGRRIPGKDTSEAVYSGIRYGIPGAINNIVALYKKRYPSANVILTGGGCREFSMDIEFDIMRKHLALEGLGMVLYERYEKDRRKNL
ncbi:MAG: type III pantothenate kinase [Candidatus Omnitrophica bacterium]|nr:type III pantothenate kinase [Candidatus Omnitrophota bacterium]